MSVFRVSALGLIVGTILAAAVPGAVPVQAAGGAANGAASGAEVAAQAKPPVRLSPPRKPQAPESPAQVDEDVAPLPPTKRQPTGSKTGPTVEIDRLQAVDPDSVGVLEESQGGFGIDMWEGTPRSLVERLIPALPSATKSRVMRDLMRRLLLSVATVPEGKATKPSLLSLRVARLAAMGDMVAVSQLLDVASAQLRDETLWKARVDSLFLVNDNAGACDQVRDLIREYQGPFWQKSFVFCQVLSGDSSGARLGLTLLRDEAGIDDPAFFTLMDALLGNTDAVVKSLANPTSLHLAMMRTARQKIPADAAETSQLAILRTIAVSPNADLKIRLGAAERAEAANVLSPDALAQIFASITFTPDELANALTVTKSENGPRGLALLYQAAKRQTVPTARAEALQAAWRLARARGAYGVAVRTMMPMLLGIKPTADLMWFAADAGRALFYAGRLEEGFAWYEEAAAEAGRDREARRARVALWPLAQLADGDDTLPWDDTMMAQWRQALEADGTDWKARGSVLLGLFDALGEPEGGAEWNSLLDPHVRDQVTMPTPAIWYRLRAAAEELRLGETVLLALVSLGNEGPRAANPILLNAVVSSLRFVGFDSEARALAIEVAVDAGV